MIRLSQLAAPAILGVALLFSPGCASSDEHPNDIPLNAQAIGTGREKVAYTAPKDGMVYVRDMTDKKNIYVGKMDKGQMIAVDAKQNQVMIDSQVVSKSDLVNDHKYTIYFSPSDKETTGAARQSSEMMQGSTPAPQTTVVTPGATVTTPNSATVTTPGAAGTAGAGGAAVSGSAGGVSGSAGGTTGGQTTVTTPGSTGQTTVTTPNGTVIKEK
jgi:hypothetical protein